MGSGEKEKKTGKKLKTEFCLKQFGTLATSAIDVYIIKQWFVCCQKRATLQNINTPLV